jgi:hypothetical protein
MRSKDHGWREVCFLAFTPEHPPIQGFVVGEATVQLRKNSSGKRETTRFDHRQKKP